MSATRNLFDALDDLNTALGALGQVKDRLSRVNADLAAAGRAPLLTAQQLAAIDALAARVRAYAAKCEDLIGQAPEVGA